MKTPGIGLIVYGALLIMGGLMGFLKAESYPSLIAGVLSGGAIILSSVPILRGNLAKIKYPLIMIMLLDAFFSYRFFSSYKWMPAGMMLVISSATLAFLLISIRVGSRPRSN